MMSLGLNYLYGLDSVSLVKIFFFLEIIKYLLQNSFSWPDNIANNWKLNYKPKVEDLMKVVNTVKWLNKESGYICKEKEKYWEVGVS